MMQQIEDNEQLEQSLIDIAVESWRFSRLFGKVVGKLDAGESGRYTNQIRYLLEQEKDRFLTDEESLLEELNDQVDLLEFYTGKS